jgi:hypothetical protein
VYRLYIGNTSLNIFVQFYNNVHTNIFVLKSLVNAAELIPACTVDRTYSDYCLPRPPDRFPQPILYLAVISLYLTLTASLAKE